MEKRCRFQNLKIYWKDKKIIFLVFFIWNQITAWSYILFSNQEAVNWYFVKNANFSDFFTPMQKPIDLTYKPPHRSNYPPLANLFFYCLRRLGTAQEYEDFIYDTTLGLALLLYVSLSIVFLYEIYKKMFRYGNPVVNNLCALALLLCGPYLFLYSRANNVLMILPFLAFFVLYYDSGHKVLREAAMIFLALAVAIKIYPVFYMLLLVKKDSWKKCVRQLIYIAFFFFTPFLAYGRGSIMDFIANLLDRDQRYVLNHTIGLKSSIQMIAGLWTGKIFMNDYHMIKVIGLIVVLVIFVYADCKWKKIFAVSLLSIWVFNGSFFYNLCYLGIPFLYFLDEREKSRWNGVYMALFLAVFMITFLPEIDWFNQILEVYGLGKITWSIVIPDTALLILVGVLFAETMADKRKMRGL